LKDSRVRGRFIKEKPIEEQQQRKEPMNTKFDELTKAMAQSVTRRAALKKFGVGLAGMALACLGLVNKAEGRPRPCNPSGFACMNNHDCCSGDCRKPGEGARGFCL